MSAIALVARRPVDVARLLIIFGVMAAFTAVVAADLRKECHKGAFSMGFSCAFDIARCDLVVRVFSTEMRWRGWPL